MKFNCNYCHQYIVTTISFAEPLMKCPGCDTVIVVPKISETIAETKEREDSEISEEQHKQYKIDQLREQALSSSLNALISVSIFSILLIGFISTRRNLPPGSVIEKSNWRDYTNDVFAFLMIVPGMACLGWAISEFLKTLEAKWMHRQVRNGRNPHSTSLRLTMNAFKGFYCSFIFVLFGIAFWWWMGWYSLAGVFVGLIVIPVIWINSREVFASIKEAGRWEEIERRGEQHKFRQPKILE